MGMLRPVSGIRSMLNIRNGVPLYTELILFMMDKASPTWWSAARIHVWKLQVLQCRRVRIANNAPRYVANRHIDEDLGITFFAYHVACTDRVLTHS